jgi:hypothetical protein
VRQSLAAALLCLALSPASAPARELWRSGEVSLELSGSVRELAVATRGTDAGDFEQAAGASPAVAIDCARAETFPDCPAFDTVGERRVLTSLTRLRTRLDLRLSPHWSAVAVYDHELLAGNLDTLEAELGESLASQSFLGAEGVLESSRHARWSHLLYRGFVAFESSHFELTLGRQRIPWGVGRLWNPIDRFNAIPPLALEGDQSPGVDAVSLRWLPSGFTSVEAVFAPADGSARRAYALRLHGVARDVDYSLVAGVFERALTLGFDLAGNLGDAAARLEVVYSDPEGEVWPVGAARREELPHFWQVVGSVDHLFDIGTGVYVLLEHLYNGNALGFGHGRAGVLLPLFEATDAAPPIALPPDVPLPPGPYVTSTSSYRFGGSRVISGARHQTGVQLGYDLTPEIRGELLLIFDWSGTSASFLPTFRYAPLDWLELTLGAQLFAGPRRSQYGDAQPLGFLLAEAFF